MPGSHRRSFRPDGACQWPHRHIRRSRPSCPACRPVIRPSGTGRHAGGRRGVNLALWAPEASEVWLCLFDDAGRTEQQRLRLSRLRATGSGMASWPGRVRRPGLWLAGGGALGAGRGPALQSAAPAAGPVCPSGGWPQYAGRSGNRYLGHDPDHSRTGRTQLDNAAQALKARVLAPAVPRARCPGRWWRPASVSSPKCM